MSPTRTSVAWLATSRLVAVAETATTTVRLAGRPEIAQVLDASGGKGRIAWSMADGRLPAEPDEIALGARLARELRLATGDVVETVDPRGWTPPAARGRGGMVAAVGQ